MGVMRFLVGACGRAEAGALSRAYLGGSDGRVFPARVSLEGETLVCSRESGESARLHVAYPVAGFGKPVLNTASLRERQEPYLLPVELARGRLGLLRDQIASWQQVGMEVPGEVIELLKRGQDRFGRAACAQGEPDAACELADDALAALCEASERVIEAYVRQRLAVRRKRSSHLPVLLACPLGMIRPGGAWERPFATAFTAAAIDVEWRFVEPRQGEYEWTLADEQLAFAERNRLTPVGGPLLDFGRGGMPDWLWQWGSDYYSLQSFVSDFVETAATRYAGRVRLWEVAARPNTGGALCLDEEHRLALAARAVEVARQVDDDLQLSLRVDQPWGEYQAGGGYRLSPLQFVDALVRSGIGLTGLTLEVAVGYRPGGSAYRDRFELSRLIDVWSGIGLPLTVALAFPSQSRRDAGAQEGIDVAEPQWKATWGEPAQAAWLAETLTLLMAKPSVVGIEWAHYSDAVAHRFPHAGLVRADGSAKPALERLTRLRQSYWQRGRDAG
jgi:hypothetical protein